MFRVTNDAKGFAQREILKVPQIKDVVDDSDSDMSYPQDPEDEAMHTTESPPRLPAALSPQPSAMSSSRLPPSVSIESSRGLPSMPAGKLVKPENMQSTLFQARTTPAAKTSSYDHKVEIAGLDSPEELLNK